MYPLMFLKDLGLDPASDQARRAVGVVRDRSAVVVVGTEVITGVAAWKAFRNYVTRAKRVLTT